MLVHHMVIRDGKIANYQPYPPTPWNASPRDSYGTPGPYEDAVQNTPIFEENGPENFKGVDIMRAVRSFDPCLPCGVHMYTGQGQGQEGDAHAHGAVLGGPEMAVAELEERIQRLTAELERVARSGCARGSPRSWPAAVLELHGEGLERMLAALDDDARARLADDGVVGSLLLIHGLHPVPLEERVHEALDEVRPYMESHGGNVELLGVEDGVARLRLMGSCDGCAASSSTLELAVEKALEETAPDLLGMEVEGAVGAGVTGTPLPLARRGTATDARRASSDWPALDGVDDLAEASCARSRGGRAAWWWPAWTARCSPTATPARRAASSSRRPS